MPRVQLHCRLRIGVKGLRVEALREGDGLSCLNSDATELVNRPDDVILKVVVCSRSCECHFAQAPKKLRRCDRF